MFGGSQPLRTLVPKDLVLSSGFCGHMHTSTHMHKHKHTQMIKINLKKEKRLFMDLTYFIHLMVHKLIFTCVRGHLKWAHDLKMLHKPTPRWRQWLCLESIQPSTFHLYKETDLPASPHSLHKASYGWPEPVCTSTLSPALTRTLWPFSSLWACFPFA